MTAGADPRRRGRQRLGHRPRDPLHRRPRPAGRAPAPPGPQRPRRRLGRRLAPRRRPRPPADGRFQQVILQGLDDDTPGRRSVRCCAAASRTCAAPTPFWSTRSAASCSGPARAAAGPLADHQRQAGRRRRRLPGVADLPDAAGGLRPRRPGRPLPAAGGRAALRRAGPPPARHVGRRARAAASASGRGCSR